MDKQVRGKQLLSAIQERFGLKTRPEEIPTIDEMSDATDPDVSLILETYRFTTEGDEA